MNQFGEKKTLKHFKADVQKKDVFLQSDFYTPKALATFVYYLQKAHLLKTDQISIYGQYQLVKKYLGIPVEGHACWF